MEGICKECLHYGQELPGLRICKRYPVYQDHSPEDTCGEFKPKLETEHITE